ncbi:Detected protein of confused Function [Hibiscus syriacus]|uniref:Detected protein of confused Function n=1 Tax=Hibiscus syriacus TaxID=106335 RepID=A0A6A2ZPE4_HIBSY|nr:Detected protein of confused Function [Hibiscus syriacus]
MDYNDNKLQSPNLHLAGEGNSKFPPVLRPYGLPRFDFDDNLHGHLRFDSLAETEVFLGIESCEDNQWIEDFSQGSTEIVFSSSAAEPCSISRRNNVWSEAASSESVEMLLKSVGQDDSILGQTTSKDSDAHDELGGGIIKHMEPSLKHGDSDLTKVGNGLQPASQTGEIPGKFSGLNGDVLGDLLFVDSVSQAHELKAPKMRSTDLSVRDESKDDEQIVVNENQVEASVDQFVDNKEQVDNFASGSQVDILISSVQNACANSALLERQDTTYLKNVTVDENVVSLARESVALSQEIHIDGENLIGNAVASVTSDVHKHSVSDMQSGEDGHVGNIIPTVGEPSDRILKENSDLHMVEGCSEGLGVESTLQTDISNDNVLSVGTLHDISPMPFVGVTTIKEQESEISNIDTQISVSRESKLDNLDSMVQITSNATEKKDLPESDCHSDPKILSSKSEKYFLSEEDGKGSMGEGDGAPNTLGAEPMRVDEEFIVTEHTDDSKFEQNVSAAEKQNTKSTSDCSKTDCMEGGSLIVLKGGNELASIFLSDVAISGKSDCMLLPSGKNLPAAAVLDPKEVQSSSPEASFSIIKTSGISSEGASCETGGQSFCKKDDQSLSMEDTSNAVGQSGEQTLHSVTLEAAKDIHASSVISDSTVKETDDDEAQVISRGSSGPSGVGSIPEKNKTSTNSVPSTSKELSHADQNHPEDSDPKLHSQEFSGHIDVHHADGDHAKTYDSSFPSASSSESQSKTNLKECGSSADLDNPFCGSPILTRTSEQPESKIGMNTVKGSKDLKTSVSGIISEEANKEHSISQDTKGNDASSMDRSFTFEVPPMESLSKTEVDRNWQPFASVQHDKIYSAGDRTPSTSGSTKNVCGGSKGTSESRTRRAGSKSTGKAAAKKGIVGKDKTPARQSERSDKTGNASLSTAEIGQLGKSNEMQHFEHMEVFHQPFTDLQQVQLRAQIFVYGALIQLTVPDESCMISAFGGPDGRTIWEKAWRACMDRAHCQKSHLENPETPLQAHIGAKTPDQSIKQNVLQTKITSSPASQSSGRGTPTTTEKPMIPLSSPLWTIPTPAGDAVQPSSFPRGAVVDYRQSLSLLHTSPIRNFVGHNAPWVSQYPFRGPWVPQSSASDSSAHFPVLPITEAVNLTPERETTVPNSSVIRQVSTVLTVQSEGPANAFAGTPLLDNKKVTSRSSQNPADPKPRKRKKSVSEDPGKIILHSQAESVLATVVNSHASTPAGITSPATIISKLPTNNFITSVAADHIKNGDRDSDQKATLSEETLGKLKEAQKQAEAAAALAAAAVSHTREIWNQLEKQKNSELVPDVETKLTSTAVAIAAAASVAKAAAAAASVASNAAIQAKLMADEASVSSGYRNPLPTTNAISSGSVNLDKATPASDLRGEDAATSSNFVIVAAKEASTSRVEAASAASKQAENMDAVVKAAELAAEAVSQAGKIVMGEPFSLTKLVEAGPEAYWKVPHAPSEPDDVVKEHVKKGGNVEAPGSFSRHPQEVPIDKSEKQSNNHEMSSFLRDMARESMQDHSRLTDEILGAAATFGNDKMGQKGLKASDIAKSTGVPTNAEHGKEEETLKDNNMREGSHVEVLRDGGCSKVAWFLADILDLKDGKAYVCYNELRSEDGDRLKEWVELEGEGDRTPRIRTARPITVMPFERTRKRRRGAMEDYNWSVGDSVDAWMQDSWWEGVVKEQSKKDETSYTVHFPAQGETSVVKAWLLRPSLVWKNRNWVEWSSSRDNDGSSREGDTPLEKRPRIGSPVADSKDERTKSFDNEESKKPDDKRLLDLPVGEKIFNIGKCTRDESMLGSQRMKRSGLKKEGSRVIFGVPKPGKKRKFMEVSKHYVADQTSRTHETSDSAKFTKKSMPRGPEPGRTKSKIEPKEKRMVVSKPKVLKSGKTPSVSSRTVPQKDSLSSNVGSKPDDAENISGEHNTEFRSFPSSDGAAECRVLFSSMAASSDVILEKASISNAKSERISKGKLAPGSGKSARVEEETKTVSEAVEPRRSNRKIQPTSRLLEGLQSSLLVSKVPVLHDKGQSRSTRGNNQG